MRKSCRRQRNNWLVWMPAVRAISEATAPSSNAAATIRSFSARELLPAPSKRQSLTARRACLLANPRRERLGGISAADDHAADRRSGKQIRFDHDFLLSLVQRQMLAM
jgi:hypothetical protein